MTTETDNSRTRRRDAAKRALAEAARRRQEDIQAQLPPEKGGQEGPEPTRYGDWEKKGIVTDF
ncbi:MAG TPA: DUF1674 domain-containing protein [Rhodobiaceae bacterium]|nr:DUF1674 domain-containing protein [Rhodobiaceae bacterium]HCV48407.1 DUF1674 domain-containing protein [Rhodobiaceae bacterium]|tara:strand:- start:2854 stop:3042 length:189 start_codon:yes stop_codon:yes gene_type:complete